MILYASNISTGGGKILLDEVISSSYFGKLEVIYLDTRYSPPTNATLSNTKIVYVKPKLIHRIWSQIMLYQSSRENPNSTVVCFGNLPPLFKLSSKTIVYLQNAFILPGIASPKDNIKTFSRILFEKLWFKIFIHNATEIWVQTKWMKNVLEENIIKPVLLKPIIPLIKYKNIPLTESGELKKSIDFISITGAYRHKNLIQLLEAILESNIVDKKFVIVTDFVNCKINNMAKEIRKRNIQLDLRIHVERNEIYKLLSHSKCMIITSSIESFCLPLHESMHFNLDLIAPHLPFILEYKTPDITIDPLSKESIKVALIQYIEPQKKLHSEDRKLKNGITR
ncbi:MAG: glycosyltransferase [Bacteriovoracaceae bacterium]|nr:glycosyltransferase [Bacteriovoracaceae bacterium]